MSLARWQIVSTIVVPACACPLSQTDASRGAGVIRCGRSQGEGWLLGGNPDAFSTAGDLGTWREDKVYG